MGLSPSATILPDQGDNVIRTFVKETEIKHKGYGYELFQLLKQHSNSDDIAQIEVANERTDTFKDLNHRCIQLAIQLKKLGVTPEDIVTPCTSNHLNSIVVYLAPLFIGAKIAALDPYMDVVEMKQLLELLKPKVIFIISDIEQKVENLLSELEIQSKLIVFGETSKHTSFDDLMKSISEDEKKSFTPWVAKNPKDTAFIMFSSGSTGVPKGVCCSHNSAVVKIIEFVKTEIPQGYVIVFCTLSWGSEIFAIVATLVHGSTKLVCTNFEPLKTWEYIKKYRPLYVCLAPHDCIAMIKHGNPSNVDTSCVQVVAGLGGGLSVGSIEALKKLFPSALVTCPYGLTETLGQIFSIPREKVGALSKKPNAVGWPVSGSCYKIVNTDTGKICGSNERGELNVKTKYDMSGYYKLDSSSSWDEDGFLKTGDIGYYDEDFCFFIVDRLKEMLRYKMHAIPPTQLENVLQEHPAVKFAVVIGIPSDEGDLALALIVKKDSVKVNAKELEDFLASKVDKRKTLQAGVRFIKETDIPLTPSGKIKRYALRNAILEMIKKSKT